ncbi:phosphoethanolamine transferase [Aquabacterium sp. J223]|uniref:phosphoethanolamine transferase n=1 Tax=Aquabacterium sp. J223 TaxID=2898431 RepID=UPI0021AE0E4A|nr:phosphoethanolamine--lipid A transferase [Aquabacterium sp. J223]UUX97225.1 phosphoethanolamine--lipid A transferase [Aquabacterium sp. J223]
MPLPRLHATSDRLVLAASAFWTLSANAAVLQAGLDERGPLHPGGWAFTADLLLLLFALHVLLLGLVATRRTVRPLLTLLLPAAAAASYFGRRYGVVLDPTMLRNVLRTDVAEARELLSLDLALHLLLFAALPMVLLWRVQVLRRPWPSALRQRALLVAGAAIAAVALAWAGFQPLSSLLRNQREVRWRITPANLLWSSGAVLLTDAKAARQPRQPIGLDVRRGPSWSGRDRPLVVLLVVGETARAASWGLNGHGRQTTPELARLDVVNFPDVTACGTNTETSLPCLFAPVGRRRYDEARIRREESLLHVVARAGAQVQWRDNQSGCKGVCDSLPTQTVAAALAPGLCPEGRCLDEGLVHDLGARLSHAAGTHLWVLHMLGSHGPAYFARHPENVAPYQPECRHDDLRRCSVQEVVNAYDNSLRYTDHVLASAVATLRAHAGRVDSVLVYVSDHGESLGEHNLFLHGLPYAIAPEVQKRVPMVWWTSPGLERAAGLRDGCLRPALQAAAARPLSHDQLFHSLLGLLDLRTALHEPALDLTAPCRVPAG